MSYTNKTEFYEIPLPIESDLFNPMDWNESMEAVDIALHSASSDSSTAVDTANAASDAAAAATSGLEELSGIVNTEKGKLTALTARVTSAENEIDDVRADASDMITAFNEPTATSTHAYAIGDTFIYNNVLYKATAAIAISDTIVPNTNCEAINVETQIAAINSSMLCRGQKVLTLATGNGSKTVSQLMNEAYQALTNYNPASDNASYFKIESFAIPAGGSSILQHVESYDKKIYTSFTDSVLDAGETTPRATVVYSYGVRFQTTDSLFKRFDVADNGTVTATNLSTQTVDNNVKLTTLITLFD